MWVGRSIVPVSRGYGDVQPGATPRGPESRSVQPALRLRSKGVPFVTGPKGTETAAPTGLSSRLA